LSFAAACGALLLCAACVNTLPATRAPYADLGTKGAGFAGPGRDDPAPVDAGPIKIGLFAPERIDEGRELKRAAELAIAERNAAGGLDGKLFEAVFRADDGPWGVVSKQVVALAYEDEALVIVGGLDGTRAHLAELVAAKAWVPVVTPVAGDLSIDYANVPWIFRAAPSDAAQAAALCTYARERGFSRLAVLLEGERDAIIAGTRIADAARRAGVTLDPVLQFDPKDFGALAARADVVASSAVLVWGRAASCERLLQALRAAGVKAPALGPGLLAVPRMAALGDALGELVVAAPFDPASANAAAFIARWERETGAPPSPVAVLSYDTVRMVLDAIARAGQNRARVRDELARASFEGFAGRIEFTQLGGNPRPPVLLRAARGQWERVAPQPVHDAVAPR
jgi:branched-chain amino acid transport system substrate-binding protein